MLEIVVLIVLGQKIAKMARSRGRAAWPWVILLIACWYGGAIAAGVTAAIVMAMADPQAAAANPNDPPEDLLIFIGAALVGAICGAVFAFVVVSQLPDVRDQWDDEDERPERRPRRRYESEEDDRRGSGSDRDARRRYDEEEDDDYTRRGRRDER
jgi:hypothetical protein